MFDTEKCTVSGKEVDVSSAVNLILMNTHSRAGGIYNEWSNKVNPLNKLERSITDINGLLNR